MSDVSRNAFDDPYEVVLADLRAKRDEINRVIQALQTFRSGSVKPVAPLAIPAEQRVIEPAVSPVTTPAPAMKSPYLGMTIVDGTKAVLIDRLEPMGNADVVKSLRAGGMVLNSSDPINTVSSVLTRRFNQIGDIVRVGRGTWALADWYPDREFKRKPTETVRAPTSLSVANRFDEPPETNEAPADHSAEAS